MNTKIKLIGLFILFCLKSFSQGLHVDYKQTVGTPYQFEVEIWISNQTGQELQLSALNNVFGYLEGLSVTSTVTMNLSPKFKGLMSPINSLIADKKIIRATQVPVLNSSKAIEVSEKPELFGTISVRSNSVIGYPLVLTPAIQGNPTVQSIVYFNRSINSTALTLQSMSITTDENPLVLRLMGEQVAKAEDNSVLSVYPNPTTNLLYFDATNLNLENRQIEVYNQLGKLVYKLNHNDLQAGFIDLSGFTAGSYFISARDGGSIVLWQKVIKVD